MTDNEERLLWVLVHIYKYTLYWRPDSNTCKKVHSVSMRKSDNEEFDEPGLCANFDDGTYAALYASEFSHFMILREITTEVISDAQEMLLTFDKQKIKEEFF